MAVLCASSDIRARRLFIAVDVVSHARIVPSPTLPSPFGEPSVKQNSHHSRAKHLPPVPELPPRVIRHHFCQPPPHRTPFHPQAFQAALLHPQIHLMANFLRQPPVLPSVETGKARMVAATARATPRPGANLPARSSRSHGGAAALTFPE